MEKYKNFDVFIQEGLDYILDHLETFKETFKEISNLRVNLRPIKKGDIYYKKVEELIKKSKNEKGKISSKAFFNQIRKSDLLSENSNYFIIILKEPLYTPQKGTICFDLRPKILVTLNNSLFILPYDDINKRIYSPGIIVSLYGLEEKEKPKGLEVILLKSLSSFYGVPSFNNPNTEIYNEKDEKNEVLICSEKTCILSIKNFDKIETIKSLINSNRKFSLCFYDSSTLQANIKALKLYYEMKIYEKYKELYKKDVLKIPDELIDFPPFY